MHEFSLASEIVAAALDAAGARDITAVHISLASGSHLDGSVLRDAFAMAAAGTAATDAALEITVGAAHAGDVAVTAIDVAD